LLGSNRRKQTERRASANPASRCPNSRVFCVNLGASISKRTFAVNFAVKCFGDDQIARAETSFLRTIRAVSEVTPLGLEPRTNGLNVREGWTLGD
jgi:hypothetical protein